MGGGSSSNPHNANVLFYQNEFAPPVFGGLTLGEACEFWHGNYETLDQNDQYIHWLFPTKDCGRNREASPLTDEEIKIMKDDDEISHRFMASFDMMLDFFGMGRTGTDFELKPNSDERLTYVKANKKNYFRITRILTSLRLLGFDGIWESWLHFLLQLIDSGVLSDARASYKEFWVRT